MPVAAPSRKAIAVRLLYTIFFLIVFEIIKLIIQVTVLFQYVHLFITMKPNEPVRRLADKLSVYAYRVLRYTTLCENTRPFPFADFPQELEPPDAEPEF